ncbi:SURF1 family protein [Actibacterium sp. MT2.3-13A]|uniref:SURF1 family protein n=1 Tax=Actibacterium sp. MT2.3-13A TaxID=2828332 RepID=UPI001BAAA840|nr:SURF1 family protein [Actibacterium sp. MT2.3-13A]
MTKRMILPLIFGVVGAAILLSLGTWQLRRLAWKEGVLAEIEARIHDSPVALPAAPDPETDRFLPVQAAGRFTGEQVRVLASVKRVGAGHRLIAAFETDGRRVLVDRGFLPLQSGSEALPEGTLTLTGNLHWPDEVDSFTPGPEPDQNLWFARDVPALAGHMGTEPVLIVAREVSGQGGAVAPLPVDTSGIPNDHLGYAVTWFGLAIVWLGMTGLLLWRIRRKTV